MNVEHGKYDKLSGFGEDGYKWYCKHMGLSLEHIFMGGKVNGFACIEKEVETPIGVIETPRKFPLAPMGVLAPRLRMLDGPLIPPST